MVGGTPVGNHCAKLYFLCFLNINSTNIVLGGGGSRYVKKY